MGHDADELALCHLEIYLHILGGTINSGMSACRSFQKNSGFPMQSKPSDVEN
jgi:hypothetical protein